MADDMRMDNITANRLTKARKMADHVWSSLTEPGGLTVHLESIEPFRVNISDLSVSVPWWGQISQRAGCKSDPGPETVEMCRALLIAKCDGALSVIDPFPG